MGLIKVPDDFESKGHIIVRGYRVGAIDAVRSLAEEAMDLVRMRMRYEQTSVFRRRIERALARIRAQIDATLASYALGLETATDNLIMTGSLTGRDLLVQYLIAGTTYSGGLNYGALGTGSTTPAASDTQLTAEVARVAPSTAFGISNNE